MEAAETDPGVDPAPGIGARLRGAREQRGLTLEECAERLYLPPSVLEALETEQFAALGAGVYARGHLRRYAGLLEMDATALEQTLLQRMGAAPDLAAIVTRNIGKSRPGRRMGLLPVAIFAVALALAVLVWWSARHAAESAPAPTPIPIPATQGETVAPPATMSQPALLDAPLIVAAADPRPVPPTAPVAATAPAMQVAHAQVAPAKAAAATPRRAAPQPVVPPLPSPPRETRSDYMNFDF